ncbi:hypothetical protein [Microbispora corallina]|nr:hypothetical protein [Microbispora corallina]
MRGNKPTDQLVAPAPAVHLPDDDTAQTVIAPNRQTYDYAVAHVAQHSGVVDTCQTDIDGWNQEIDSLERQINERRAWIEMRTREQEAARQQVLRGQKAAKAAADILALLGAPVPPANGELSHAPDVAHERFNAATEEQTAAAERGRS